MTTNIILFANETVGDFYQFARLQAMSEWWHWLLLLAVCLGICAYVVYMYRKDSVELPRAYCWILIFLRVAALAGVLFYFMNLEKRTERKLVKNSKVAILVDTSQSMGLQDKGQADVTSELTRIQQVVQLMDQGKFLKDLRTRHDVVVYGFDQESKPREVASFQKLPSQAEVGTRLTVGEQYAQSLQEARLLSVVGAALLVLAILLGASYLAISRGRRAEAASWLLLGGFVVFLLSFVVLAVSNLRNPDVTILALVGRDGGNAEPVEEQVNTGDDQEEKQLEPSDVDWSTELAARGLETRLGEAVRYLINKERGGPIAGIAVFTDGRSNAGVEYVTAMNLARLTEIPLYPVGLGSVKRPMNVRVVDLEAPERVYPEDHFTLTGYLQSNGFVDRSGARRFLDVRLTSYPTGAADVESVEVLEDEDGVELMKDGEIVTVQFEVSPSEAGRRTYQLSVTPPALDHNGNDNSKTANVEVVERKTKVLLMAGGPSREFRFLRNQLFRDRDVSSDVYLQSGQPGMSQECDEVLFDFPIDEEALFDYDCIIAFDPDWTELDVLQIRALERWVAEQAGGLIVVAGPVHTPQWADLRRSDARFNTVRSLYPVVLYSSGSATLGLGRFGGDEAWPLDFTREGLESRFLWLEDTAVDSEAAWASFEGIYGYYAVKDPKPGARVYARFSDPSTAIDGVLPIYMAGHFYGAGRVFFQASGEMWRIRSVDETYFEQYYTKLIRWVSQGRLLRDSKRGVLLVDRDRCLLGDSIGVQAILMDAQNQPLTDPEVTATLIDPNGERAKMTLRLVKGGVREGAYAGQFTAVEEGDYRVELRPPHGELDELLLREVRVRVPALEIEQPERNDALLRDLAQSTGGAYYVGTQAAAGVPGGQPPLANIVEPQDHVTFLPGTPDRRFEFHLMAWLMGLICGVLSLEWLLRRLSRLA